MKRIHAFVVSLERRPERLTDFIAHARATEWESLFEFEPFDAIDGTKLNLDELRPRIGAWNLKHMSDRQLRGNLGCTLSHVELWRRIAQRGESVAVFEDDARLCDGIDVTMIGAAFRCLPRIADVVWLNDYNYQMRGGMRFKLRRKLAHLVGERLLRPRRVRITRMPDILTTTEAYILSPAHAQRLLDGIKDNLGAVDRHMQLFNAKSRCRAYQSEPPLFTQADRNDSETKANPAGILGQMMYDSHP